MAYRVYSKEEEIKVVVEQILIFSANGGGDLAVMLLLREMEELNIYFEFSELERVLKLISQRQPNALAYHNSVAVIKSVTELTKITTGKIKIDTKL